MSGKNLRDEANLPISTARLITTQAWFNGDTRELYNGCRSGGGTATRQLVAGSAVASRPCIECQAVAGWGSTAGNGRMGGQKLRTSGWGCGRVSSRGGKRRWRPFLL